ncbi:MAG: glycoside hydrolase family 127 protein, partial [Anaerolineae bacterium]|nr:glycoside hydrolase family 127 protein [Anaerolineae bacterium]
MSKRIDRRSFLKQAAVFGGAALLPMGDLMLSRQPATVLLSPGGTNLDQVWLSPGFRVNSPLMSDRLKQTIINWIPWCYSQLNNTSLAEGGINNFIQAARKLSGQSYSSHVGYWFSNAYVLNTFESMCIACMLDPQGDSAITSAQNAFRSYIDNWLPRILAACESDGYMQTWTTLGNHARWSDRAAHEGYVAGYFLDAAMAHYLMTDRSDATFYNAAKRLADCWYNNIGPSPKKTWWDGHQGMEQSLCTFARFVNDHEGGGVGNKYYELAKFLLDSRCCSGTYDQSHAYPVDQTTAVGHAVRAVYMYSGMIDVAMLADSNSYYNAVNTIWDNMINRKLYVTGGVGSGETSEGFGGDYSLPNDAYCESCSGCGHLYLQYKMMLAYQDARYADLAELTFFNAILGDLDLSARNYCYTNPLDQDWSRYNWHSCPCCVGNIPRTLLSFPTWMYATDNGGLYINMFIGSTVSVPNVGGTTLEVVQSTNYPWDGNVSITINPATSANFTVRVRAPNRDVSALYTYTPEASGFTSISVNGSAITPAMNKGYAEITRAWVAGDRIDIVLPMPIQRVNAIDNVAADRGRVALQRGPLIYNIESVDQNVGLTLDSNAPLSVQWNGSLLNGVNTINGNFNNGAALTAIPNYARNNRGGRSIVWMLERKVAGTPTATATTPPPQTDPVTWYRFDESSGTTAADASGSGRNATLVNGPTWVSGAINNAVNLDGSNDYISIPGGIVSGLGDFSIATWVRLDSISSWSRVFDFGTGTSVN